jgi:hypothetical protein
MENDAEVWLQRFYAAVGHVAVNWASVELLLDILVLKGRSQLSGGDDWLKHQLAEKISTVRAQILPRLAGELPSRLARIVNEIEHLSTIRNQLIHGAVIIDRGIHDPDQPITFATMLQPRKKARRPPLRAKISQLHDLAEKIDQLYGELLDLFPNGNFKLLS